MVTYVENEYDHLNSKCCTQAETCIIQVTCHFPAFSQTTSHRHEHSFLVSTFWLPLIWKKKRVYNWYFEGVNVNLRGVQICLYELSLFAVNVSICLVSLLIPSYTYSLCHFPSMCHLWEEQPWTFELRVVTYLEVTSLEYVPTLMILSRSRPWFKPGPDLNRKTEIS